MRSSIACSRCRRSKVKCVNNGIGTTCRACENTGRECTYPSPALTGGQAHHVRREGSVGKAVGSGGVDAAAPAGDTPKRARPKKVPGPPPVTNNVHSRDSIRPIVDALDASILTPKVWIELFELYQLHFATDMPFLHPPTFLKPLRQASTAPPTSSEFGPPSSTTHVLPPYSPMVLLAFLALTARYHPQLIAHHSPPSSNRPSNPCIASEYYAAAAKSRLAGNLGDGLGTPEIERVQALMMLALFDWGNCQGAKGWISVGVGLRYAQILGLQYEAELDDQPWALSHSMRQVMLQMDPKQGSKSQENPKHADDLIEREIKRRTFWSCFIMDRYMSSGKFRPQAINSRDVRIQLPSSERAFLFGERVRTLLLADELDDIEGKAEAEALRRSSFGTPHLNGDKPFSPPPRDSPTLPRLKQEHEQSDPNRGRWEVGADESINSRFVKALDLYGRLIKWSCSGGRRTESYPPWDPKSIFYQLQQQLNRLVDSLPRDMTLTPANVSAHITSRTSTPYTMLHAVILLCQMFLHREFIPFIPLRCSGPEGPLDPPTFPKEKYTSSQDFWRNSARQLFKSARELMDLVRTCQEWGVLAETPIVGFAIYTAAFMGVYAINFPWMDSYGSMCTSVDMPTATGGAEAARKALEMTGQMRPRLKMADGWFKTIRRIHLYFMRMKKDFRRNIKASGGLSAQHTSIREGRSGGGLEEWKALERTLKDFGRLEDDDLEMPDAPLEDAESKAGYGENDMATDNESPKQQQQGWASINSGLPGGHSSNPAADVNDHPQQQQQPYQQSGFSTVNSATSPTGHKFGSTDAHSYAPPAGPSGAANGANAMGYASAEDARSNAQPPQPPQQANSDPMLTQPWSWEMEQKWLNGLPTTFSGDDIAVFVEGNECQDWAGIENSGWLNAVWE